MCSLRWAGCRQSRPEGRQSRSGGEIIGKLSKFYSFTYKANKIGEEEDELDEVRTAPHPQTVIEILVPDKSDPAPQADSWRVHQVSRWVTYWCSETWAEVRHISTLLTQQHCKRVSKPQHTSKPFFLWSGQLAGNCCSFIPFLKRPHAHFATLPAAKLNNKILINLFQWFFTLVGRLTCI